eukprot:82698-Prorocentrum_minimum.AAC.1
MLGRSPGGAASDWSNRENIPVLGRSPGGAAGEQGAGVRGRRERRHGQLPRHRGGGATPLVNK